MWVWAVGDGRLFQTVEHEASAEALAEVEGHNLDAELRQTMGEGAVAAGDMQHTFTGLQVEQPVGWRIDNLQLESIIFSDVIGPLFRIGFPDLPCLAGQRA